MSTRTSSPLNPPVCSELKLNDRLYEVQCIRAIQKDGVLHNEIILPEGVSVPGSKDGKMEVPNSALQFTDGNQKGRTYRLVRADKSVKYSAKRPTLAEGDKLFKWILFDWKEDV